MAAAAAALAIPRVLTMLPAGGDMGTLIKRTISLAGRRTSVALEEEFWAALKHIAASHQETLTTLVAEVDARRAQGRPLASALRVLALQAFLPPTVSAHARHRYR
jgi:predicted DNA-binding ribbon-helix-helix protein